MRTLSAAICVFSTLFTGCGEQTAASKKPTKSLTLESVAGEVKDLKGEVAEQGKQVNLVMGGMNKIIPDISTTKKGVAEIMRKMNEAPPVSSVVPGSLAATSSGPPAATATAVASTASSAAAAGASDPATAIMAANLQYLADKARKQEEEQQAHQARLDRQAEIKEVIAPLEGEISGLREEVHEAKEANLKRISDDAKFKAALEGKLAALKPNIVAEIKNTLPPPSVIHKTYKTENTWINWYHGCQYQCWYEPVGSNCGRVYYKRVNGTGVYLPPASYSR